MFSDILIVYVAICKTKNESGDSYMKIERISQNKVKLTVSNEDLVRWGIATQNFVANSQETHELFIDLIKRAENETGVRMLDNPGLMIEAMQKPDGIVFFVTMPEQGRDIMFPPQLRKKLLRTKSVLQKVPLGIYLFSSLDDLCDYVKILSTSNVESDLYLFDKNYYLVLPEINERLAGLMDYAISVKKTELSVSFLQEYGKIIARGNALDTINKYFI